MMSVIILVTILYSSAAARDPDLGGWNDKGTGARGHSVFSR